jgi:hypothetical protein
MKIELKEITVRELTGGYEDRGDDGVVGYGGELDIRPKYQREFIYGDKQRAAVIDTLTKEFPLNVMYWAVRDGGGYEVIDGQQRTISICQYVDSVFSYKERFFHNLQPDEEQQLLDYKLMVYLCTGTDSEKLEWFQVINIAGLKLEKQELRNAVYSGSWVSDAKRYFSRTHGPAQGLGGDYMSGDPKRQAYLETAIEWINAGAVEGYMATHQHDPNANALWLYFQNVIAWVKATFPTYRREMKGLSWGSLFNEFKDEQLDSAKLEQRVASLMADEDVGNKKGIYSYVLNGLEKHLSIRAFSPNMRREAYERQHGLCASGTHCLSPGNEDGKMVFAIEEMEADHITPWRLGGRTDAANCQMLCLPDNRSKGGK